MDNNPQIIFNRTIIKMFSSIIRFYIFNLPKLLFYFKVFRNQKAAVKKRELIAEKGGASPAIMIYSITNQCNLKCAGCYNQTKEKDSQDQLSKDQIIKLFNEAGDLGIGIIMIAGGEPFIRMDILKVIKNYPDLIFPVFTNGTMLESNIDFLLECPQIFPVLSLEGEKSRTDSRRGEGLYDQIIKTAVLLKKKRIVFGVSLTLTSKNAEEILIDSFIKQILKLGAKALFFIEYVPQNDDEVDLCLSNNQKQNLIKICNDQQKKYPALFISLPGDEEILGGCMAAGRGFIHINAAGEVEPCPFAPYSTVNIKDMSLKEALSTGFLKKIRDSHSLLTESKGGCTLWENKEWVDEQKSIYVKNT